MDRCVWIVTQSIESNSANTYSSFSATVRARAASPSSLLPSSMILECFAAEPKPKCSSVQRLVSDCSIWRGSKEGECAYAVEFWEGVDADVHPLLVDAWGGLRSWHGSVFHRRRCGDSHGADGAAWKQEQRGSSSLGLHRYSSFKHCQHGDLYHVSFHISHIFSEPPWTQTLCMIRKMKCECVPFTNYLYVQASRSFDLELALPSGQHWYTSPTLLHVLSLHLVHASTSSSTGAGKIPLD